MRVLGVVKEDVSGVNIVTTAVANYNTEVIKGNREC